MTLSSDSRDEPAQMQPLPYGRQSISEADIAAVVDVLRGDWLTTGPLVGRFEQALSAWTGAPAVAVSSGTAALHTAYAAAGIGAGDTVLTSPLTFVATAATAAMLGATVTFADVEPDTGNLDVEAAAAAMTPATTAIVGVDYAGHPVAAEELSQLAHAHGAVFVEDAAHAIGSTWRGRPVGALADVTALSFYPTKNLTTAEGGAVTSTDDVLLERARRFRNHGLVRDRAQQRDQDVGGWHQEVHEFGLNYRLSDVLCALGISQLSRLGDFKRRRAQIVATYNEVFRDLAPVSTPPCREGADPMWHLYPLRVHDGQRRRLYDTLRAQGILVQVNYLPVHLHPVFADLGYRRGMFPRAEHFYAEQLSLPLFPGMTDGDVERVYSAVLAFFGQA